MFKEQKTIAFNYLSDYFNKKAKLPDIEFDDTQLKDILKNHYDTVLKKGNNIVANISAGAVPFKRTERVEKYINDMTLKISGLVNDTTKQKIKDTLKKGIKLGKTEAGIGKDLARYFNNIAPNRAKTIARTETAKTANFTQKEAWKQTGIVKKKRWSAALDERTRTPHRNANGQIVGIDEQFSVDGEGLDYPGDFAGSPGNIINCRCTMIPIMEEV